MKACLLKEIAYFLYPKAGGVAAQLVTLMMIRKKDILED